LISFIAAIFIGLYFHFTRNFNFWQKLGIPYVKPTPFFGSFKDCVLLKTTIGEEMQRIYNEHSDKPYVGIFWFDKPSLLIRDMDLVKNILVKDFQTFMDRIFSFEDKLDPLFGKNLAVLKGQLWRHLRTKLTPVFTPSKTKMMFCFVDTCGKELAECLEKATADGKLPHTSTGIKCIEKLSFRIQRNSRVPCHHAVPQVRHGIVTQSQTMTIINYVVKSIIISSLFFGLM
jgi:cytochrome P450 family 6